MAAGLELRCADLSGEELAEIAARLASYDPFGRGGEATSPVDTIDRAT